MAWEWSGNGFGMVWEWFWNGLGMALEWSGNGFWNGLGMALEWSGNEASPLAVSKPCSRLTGQAERG